MNEISTNTPTTNMQVTGNSFNSSNVASTSTKVDLVQSPIMFKKLLSMAAFFMAFATVMTLLLIYYDNTGLYINNVIYINKLLVKCFQL